MGEDNGSNNEICLIDSLKILTQDGYTNLCGKYGKIKKITIRKYDKEHRAYIVFEDDKSEKELLLDQSYFPSFIRVKMSFTMKKDYEDKCVRSVDRGYIEENIIENMEKCEVTEESPETVNNEVAMMDLRHSIYLGPNVLQSSTIIQEPKKHKIIYNLENDDLFGKPLNTKWKKTEKLEFDLHKVDFYRFENCFGGEIKVEKKLGPNMFTGWPTLFDDSENVQDKLKNVSNVIKCSEILNINNLKPGMLVGAFDISNNLYGRGYVILVAGNSVNVAMSDYGKVINTVQIRALPEELTQMPAYSFKVFTKENCVSQLKEKTYVFKIRSATSKRIVLIIFDENKEIKVQLKKWVPTVEEYGVPYIEFKNDSKVELLSIKDTNSVYLRSKQKNSFDLLFSIWDSINCCHYNSQPLNREPYYGEIVGFKSVITGNFERARIHKYIGDNIYSVKLMDNPIKEYVQLSEMKELSYEIKSMPVGFIMVRLKNVLPYPIQFYAVSFIDTIKDMCLTVHFDESSVEGWNYVDLTIKGLKENVNVILCGLLEPSWFKLTSADLLETEKNISYNNLFINKLKEKSVVDMTFVMYHNDIFYMRDKKFGKSFSLLSKMIKEYCSLNLHPYLPHSGEVCLGQFPDGLWYRVLCSEVKPGHLIGVYAVDLGNVAYLSSKNMKKMPDEMLFHRIHVYKCVLSPPVNIDANKLKILQHYENTDCKCTIVNSSYNEDYCQIECPFIEQILQ